MDQSDSLPLWSACRKPEEVLSRGGQCPAEPQGTLRTQRLTFTQKLGLRKDGKSREKTGRDNMDGPRGIMLSEIRERKTVWSHYYVERKEQNKCAHGNRLIQRTHWRSPDGRGFALGGNGEGVKKCSFVVKEQSQGCEGQHREYSQQCCARGWCQVGARLTAGRGHLTNHRCLISMLHTWN